MCNEKCTQHNEKYKLMIHVLNIMKHMHSFMKTNNAMSHKIKNRLHSDIPGVP